MFRVDVVDLVLGALERDVREDTRLHTTADTSVVIQANTVSDLVTEHISPRVVELRCAPTWLVEVARTMVEYDARLVTASSSGPEQLRAEIYV